jgi:hypothetical protein
MGYYKVSVEVSYVDDNGDGVYQHREHVEVPRGLDMHVNWGRLVDNVLVVVRDHVFAYEREKKSQ